MLMHWIMDGFAPVAQSMETSGGDERGEDSVSIVVSALGTLGWCAAEDGNVHGGARSDWR